MTESGAADDDTLFATDEDADSLGAISNLHQETENEMNCTESEFAKLDPQSKAYRIKRADCGSGYQFPPKPDAGSFKIVLFGDMIRRNILLTGCRIGAKCPGFPSCHMTLVTNDNSGDLLNADMVVMATEDAPHHMSNIARKSKKSKVRKVLYWREPYWSAVSPSFQKLQTDVTMGVFATSGIANPNFWRRPHSLLASNVIHAAVTGSIPFDEQLFAISIASICHTSSFRELYFDQLEDYLGTSRIHRYGRCGNRKLPPPPVINAAKVIAHYKFYLSFENSIMKGYITEKLFTVMSIRILPVYMGSPEAPNITIVPSFINALDFKTPKDLALYLLYLDANKTAYEEYHLWRTNSKYFTDEFLEHVARQVPGQEELRAHGQSSRIAGCCRLCDRDYVDEQIARRNDSDLIVGRWGPSDINHRLFHGSMNRRPGPGHLLKPYVKPARFKDVPQEDDDKKTSKDKDTAGR